jgi:hypothetical protein
MPTSDEPPLGTTEFRVDDLCDLWAWIISYREQARSLLQNAERDLLVAWNQGEPAEDLRDLEDTVVAAREELADIESYLARQLKKSQAAKGLWKRAFGRDPGPGEVRGVLALTARRGGDLFPLGERREADRLTTGLAVEVMYRYLLNGTGWERLCEVTFQAARRENVGEERVNGLERSPMVRARDWAGWAEQVRAILENSKVQTVLLGRGERSGPKNAAHVAVGLLTGLKPSTCRDAHRALRRGLDAGEITLP